MLAEKLRFCSQVTIKYIERDLIEIEAEIAKINANNTESKKGNLGDAQKIGLYAEYFAGRPEQLLLDQPDPTQKANYFGLLFNEAPTYSQLLPDVPDGEPVNLNPLFERISL
ncbi:MAG TPA: hypothetical protein VLF59_00930 [Candidatus Saccharimonadales bacterium]|nr:hypothetical protein [Candidatus Saccharimonadales bacterium]